MKKPDMQRRCVNCGHPEGQHTADGRCTVLESGDYCDHNRKFRCDCSGFEPIGKLPKKAPPVSSEWGFYGNEPPCMHLTALRKWLNEMGMSIWGERTEQPAGWVNVNCVTCGRTYEVTLREPFED